MKTVLTILFTLFIGLNTFAGEFDLLFQEKWTPELIDIKAEGFKPGEKENKIKKFNTNVTKHDLFFKFNKEKMILEIFDQEGHVQSLDLIKKNNNVYNIILPSLKPGGPISTITISPKDKGYTWDLNSPAFDNGFKPTPEIDIIGRLNKYKPKNR